MAFEQTNLAGQLHERLIVVGHRETGFEESFSVKNVANHVQNGDLFRRTSERLPGRGGYGGQLFVQFTQNEMSLEMSWDI